MRLPRLQFSLRTLVIVVVIVAALASWPAARYARFRGRVAAKAELAKYGIELRGENIFNEEAKELLPLSERWDHYWFGEEALHKYDFVFINDKEFFPAYEQNPQVSFRELFGRFPEVDDLHVGKQSTFADDFLGEPGNLHETRVLPRDLMLAMLALPKLTSLDISRRGVIDAEVAAALPENSLLEELFLSETTISPEAWRTILARTPHLRQVDIDQHAFDPAIVADLNRSGWPRPGAIMTEEERKYAFLAINIVDPRSVAGESLEPCVADLTIPYHLEILSVPHTVMDQLAAPLELAGYQAKRLTCLYAGNLRVRNFPALKIIAVKHCQNVDVSDAPLVETLYVQEARQLKLLGLPKLKMLTIYKCDEFEIQACPKIEYLGLEETQHAKIRDLPNLDDFFFEGGTFELHGVPKLDSVMLQNPTLRQLTDLRQLPTLKYLHIHFNGPSTKLPVTALAELQELPALERLCITGRNTRADDEELAFLSSLNKLQHLRLLWIEDHDKLPEWLAKDFEAKLLPAQLEVLLTEEPFASDEQRAAVLREYPELIYLIATEKLTGKLGIWQRFLRDIPPKAELAPYAERLGQESPASDP